MFQLKERRVFFDIKRAPYKRALALLNFISHYCKAAAVVNPTDLDIARAVLSKQSVSQKKQIQMFAFLMANYVDKYLLDQITPKNARRYKAKIEY